MDHLLPHSSESSRNRSASGKRTRLVFFCLTALWGYIVGAGVIAATAALAGRPVPLEGAGTPMIVAGLVVGVGGAVVAATAYRETRQRHR